MIDASPMRFTAMALTLALILQPRVAKAEPSSDPQYLVFWLSGQGILRTSLDIKGRLIDSSMKPFVKAGGNPGEIQPLVRHMEQSMKAGDVAEVERTMDKILSLQRGRIGGAEPDTSTFDSSELDKQVAGLIARIGTTGDGKARKLGFGITIPTFMLEKQIPGVLKAAFRIAGERDVAVHLNFDSHNFWQNRSDLWKNPENVEWSDWNGTLNAARVLDWGEPQRLPPHMCYNSPAILEEISRIVKQVIGPALGAELGALRDAKKEHLFAGITVGSEPAIDDYTQIQRINPNQAAFMDREGLPRVRLGYHALKNLGFGPKNHPKDFKRELAKVNRDFIAYWARQFVEAGVPAARLYTHVPAQGIDFGDPVVDYNNAPASTAFNPYARPGWTTYPVDRIKNDFKPLYALLEAHGNPAWGGVEANTAFGSASVDWNEYLSRHFKHGAKLVGINVGASSPVLTGRLTKSAYSSQALGAYRDFFSGKL
ncbi:MAG: hypothetical protein HY923_03600 [Elusimicrobia bacterium]|nr:hypothetical protein [Elusimicrobiota bacterium]